MAGYRLHRVCSLLSPLASALVVTWIFAGRLGAQPAPAPRAACFVGGSIVSGTQPLPGVAIVVWWNGAEVAATSTDAAGNYLARLPGPGQYTLRAELAAFAPESHDVTLAPETCAARLDFTLTLLSRAPRPAAASGAAGQRLPLPAKQPETAGRGATAEPGSGGTRPGRGFQSLAVTTTGGESAGELVATPPDAERLDVPLPPGFSPDAPTESVATSGTQGQLTEAILFGGRGGLEGLDPEQLRRRAEALGLDRGAADAVIEFIGARGGGAGGGGGRGGEFGGGPAGFALAGMRGGNRLQGNANYTLAGSMLDATPYALNGRAAERPDYAQQRYGASVGGPMKIPGVYRNGSNRTSFFLNYGGNHSSSPVDTYSTVPTAAMRTGDFSALATMVLDPATGHPFEGNRIPADRLSSAARVLLPYIPLPNLPGDTLNFHHVTAVSSTSDDINVRFTHVFGAQPQGRGGRGGRGAGGPGLGGRGAAVLLQPGGRGGRGFGASQPRSVLNVGLNVRRSSSVQSSRFPTTGATTTGRGWNVPVTYSYSKGRFTNQLSVGYNRNESRSQNLYAFVRNVAGDAGIGGVSTDPFDWGIPNLSFTTIADLQDRNPSQRVDTRLQIGDTMVRPWGRHAFRWGGGLSLSWLDSRTDTNARGSFVFTGLYTSAFSGGRPVAGTGLDFADFLLGFAQQASVQYGPGLVGFRSRSWNLFFQDDWRARGNLTLNLGVRYEYTSPYTEAQDHLVNLDVNRDFTAAAPVLAGQTGPYSGLFPASLVRPDRDNIAPRVGIAWRPIERTIVRTGYGINYNLGSYGSIAQRLAGQPPFAVTATSIGTFTSPLLLADPFARIDQATVTNSYGIDLDYRLGVVQMWNLDVQRDLPGNVSLNVGYTGTKGSSLDIQRAPNRGPTGLRIPGVQAFIWQSSEGRSIMHSVRTDVRKRLARGLSAGASYTWQRAFDNASTLGGGGSTVAQNDQDLDAEWGRSSFERRHAFSANYAVELPFGRGRPWLAGGGWATQVLGNWSWTGTLTAQSGTPFTPRVTGNFADVARGVNGTLRANYNGAPIALAHPTVERFFNTDAFSVPPAGQFGTAPRNLITGPGFVNMAMSISKDVSFGRTRGMSIRVQANNVFNTVQFSTIDTVVNSPTFGRIIGVRPMRSMQIVTRFRF